MVDAHTDTLEDTQKTLYKERIEKIYKRILSILLVLELKVAPEPEVEGGDVHDDKGDHA
jgi:hypothetical protein